MRPHLKACWTIPPKANAEFAARMEDILSVYARIHDPRRPVVCMDEKPVRHEALLFRMEVKDLDRFAVVAAG